MAKLIDITGKKFGRLTAIKFSHIKNKRHFWVFLCDCGIEKIISKIHVMDGHTRSCGCLLKENFSQFIHGMSGTRFWIIWRNMINRCFNKNSSGFIKYGKRGIMVCERWLIFEYFMEDMYESYLEHVEKYGEKNTTIERLDFNGNYEKSNCCWANFEQQNNNRKNNRNITFKGKTQTVAQWAKEKKLKYRTLHNRLVDLKWSVERALTVN